MRRTVLALIVGALAVACVRCGHDRPPPPPPPPMEVQGAMPGPGYVWQGGHYAWHHRWVWIPGHWRPVPRGYAVWVPGHYVQTRGGYFWVDGHWR